MQFISNLCNNILSSGDVLLGMLVGRSGAIFDLRQTRIRGSDFAPKLSHGLSRIAKVCLVRRGLSSRLRGERVLEIMKRSGRGGSFKPGVIVAND